MFDCDVISGNGTNLNGEGGEGEAGPLVDDNDLGPMLQNFLRPYDTNFRNKLECLIE